MNTWGVSLLENVMRARLGRASGAGASWDTAIGGPICTGSTGEERNDTLRGVTQGRV